MQNVDHTIPKDKWKFDKEVTTVFEDMLKRSIPQYTVMRNTVTKIASTYLNKPRFHVCNILDIGCSRGDAINELVRTNPTNKFMGLDISEPMLKEAKNRFKYDENVTILKQDLRLLEEMPLQNNGIILSILTIQFVPIEYRQKLIQMLYNSLIPNGIFIFVEKVLGNSAELNELMIDQYLTMKSSNGYSKEEIERKRLSLEGVLVPATAKWNEDLLKQAGFKEIDCFWRWMNFAGYIAIK